MMVFRRSILSFLDEYERSRGNSSIFFYWITTRTWITFIMLAIVVAEIVIYIIFFHDMYRHDNNPRLRQLLNPDVTKHRNRTNDISFFGQFCSFLLELSWTVISILIVVISASLSYEINTKNRLLNLLFASRFAVRIITDVSMSIIEVLTSSSLRPRIYKFSLYNFIFGLK